MHRRPQLRKKPTGDDETSDTLSRLAPRPPLGKVVLSFDPDEEGPTVKIKKKKKRSHTLPAAPPELPPSITAPTAGTYSADFLQKLRASQCTRTTDAAESSADGSTVHGASDGDSHGSVPSRDTIRLAREAREHARRIGADQTEREGSDGSSRFMPLDDMEDDRSDAIVAKMAEELRADQHVSDERRTGRSRRLISEDQEDEHDVDEMGGSDTRRNLARPPRTFGAAVDAARGGSSGAVPSSVWAGTDKLHSNVVVDIEYEARELKPRSSARVHGEVSLDQVPDSRSSDALAALSAKLSAREFIDNLDGRMASRIGSLKLTLSQQKYEGEQARTLADACSKDSSALEETLQHEMRVFEELQQAQAYTDSLLDCLNEKAPLIERIEERLDEELQALHNRRVAIQEAIDAAEYARAERVLGGVWVRPARISKVSTEAEIIGDEACRMLSRLEGQRTRRRQSRGVQTTHGSCEGWSSTDSTEEDALEETLGETRGRNDLEQTSFAVGDTVLECKDRIRSSRVAAKNLFEDALPEMCELREIRARFKKWETGHPSSYKQAYVELCLPTIFAPLVRLQLLEEDLLKLGAVDSHRWHIDICLSIGADMGGNDASEHGDGLVDIGTHQPTTSFTSTVEVTETSTSVPASALHEEANIILSAQLACKIVLPRLKRAVMYSWRVQSLSESASLRTAVQSISAATERLAAAARGGWRMTDIGAVQEEMEINEAAVAAATDVKSLLMSIAMRLEEAVDGTCIPPCVCPLRAGGAQTVANLREMEAAGEASRRRLWRAIKLSHALGLWCDVLAQDALQQLLIRLSTSHLLPYLKRCLTAEPPQVEFVRAAVEAIVQGIPDTWRYRDPGGAFTPCTAPLIAFVVTELSPLLTDSSAAISLMAMFSSLRNS